MYLVDVFHMIMQYSMHASARRSMYEELYKYDPELENIFAEHPKKVFYWLLGREMNGMS